MSKIVLKKSAPLKGEVEISGSKNSSLPILAASLLTDGVSEFIGIPKLNDVTNMLEIIRHLGGKCEFSENRTIIDTRTVNSQTAPYELMTLLRASFLVMGPLLTRFGHTKISLPGGCPIGTRPVDLHLKGFAALGAEIEQGHGYLLASAKNLHGAKIYLDFPSVGATENILMAAALASGQTTIENAAIEPEIVDLSTFLNEMGANITGAGTDTVRVTGVEKLYPRSHTIIPDRIEAGTFMVAAAITKGDVTLKNIVPSHLKPIIAKLREIGVEIIERDDSITIRGTGENFNSTDIKTLPHPGFPTDMQAPLCSLMSVVPGTSMVIETVFENRFLHIAELTRMGANIKIEGRTAVIEGSRNLTGAKVRATDLRAGAALVLAGLIADGETEIEGVEHIERGYADFYDKLKSIGASISIVD